MKKNTIIRAAGWAGAGFSAVVLLIILLFSSCGRREEISMEEAVTRQESSLRDLLALTVKRPGGQEYKIGQVGGEWVSSLTSDPKTFNTLVARDGDSRTVVDPLYQYLADYDPVRREFLPNIASFEVKVNEADGSMQVMYTLRDDLYWTLPGQSREEGVKVTSDDVIFWYDEIDGDPDLQLPAYPGQFVELEDGSIVRIEIEKIDDRSFSFHFPRVISNPILSTNMHFGPRHLYEAAKREKGMEGVLNIFSIDTDVRTIPSIGMFHLTEYAPGVRVVMRRNPNYWKRDPRGNNYPYIERITYRIVPDKNTEYLLFREGTRDSYGVRAEDLEELLRAPNRNYSVINGGESLGASFLTFNQNPRTMDPVKYSWFSRREFRQAMSSLLNRERISEQVFRGLAVPAVHFFAKANPLFDDEIRLEHTYNPRAAVRLLGEIGITRDENGIMRDPDGNRIEFDITVGAENNQGIDICAIFSDELEDIGIKGNVRPVDFQRLTEMLLNTYDWDVVHVALGANYWPEGGSNVWQSSGNFHLWHPLQESPATEWEARIDYLYNKGRFTLDSREQKRIYDEYQRIILTELPLIYTVHPLSFLAVRDKWDNVFYDTLNGMETYPLFLKP